MEDSRVYKSNDNSNHKPVEIKNVIASIKKSTYEQNHDRTTLTLVLEELSQADIMLLTEIVHSKKPVKLSMLTTSKAHYA